MAAPSTTARAAPGGRYLPDGYSTKIAFERDPNVEFFEKTVKPPGMDGGDKIDETTMHNVRWRTFYPRALVTMTESTTTVAYDPVCYNSINNNLLNQPSSITIHFPDGSTLDFYGFLKSFQPNDHTEGEQPTAEISIEPTNWDHVNDVEAAPVMTEIAGT